MKEFDPVWKIFTFYLLMLVMMVTCNTSNAQTTDTTYSFTEEEVQSMDSLFQVYEQTDSAQQEEIMLLNTQIGNYKKLNEQDSLHILFLNEKVVLLDDRVVLYKKLTKELEPKWYNAPKLHFFLGMVSTVVLIHTIDYSLPK
tara:strand:+ start:2464 stop:2889 length:426 start_codon:yes stop_codon:yes gene_type:complete